MSRSHGPSRLHRAAGRSRRHPHRQPTRQRAQPRRHRRHPRRHRSRPTADAASRGDRVVGAGRTFVAGADIKGLEGMVWGDMSGAPDMHDTFQLHRGLPQARRDGHARHGARRRPGTGHGRPLPRGHPPTPSWDSPRSTSASSPAPRARSGCRAWSASRRPSRCASRAVRSAPTDALRAGLIEWIVEGDLVAGAVSLAREKADLPRPAAAHARPHATSCRRRARCRRCSTPVARWPPRRRSTWRHRARSWTRSPRRPRCPSTKGGCGSASCSSSAPDPSRPRRSSTRSSPSAPWPRCRGCRRTRRPRSKSVAIVGAGTMGGGIAMACANAGLDVTLTDTEQAQVDKGLATIATQLRDVGRPRAPDRRGRAHATGPHQARRSGAAPFAGRGSGDRGGVREHGRQAGDLQARSTPATRPDCILATNTSTLDIDAIASATSRAATVIGLHFFSPAHVMRLVEIVRGRQHGPGHRRRCAGAGQEAGQGRRGRAATASASSATA